jgi:NADP-dependent aldehyde dehydrogenase
MKTANARPDPIPVYAEMSSVNPVLLLPGALAARAETLGKEFVASLNLGVGQFCTNPGVLLALEGPDLQRFIDSAAAALLQVAPGVMLTQAIQSAYDKGVARLHRAVHVKLLAQANQSAFFAISAPDLAQHPEALEEVFGPAAVLVRCQTESQLAAVLEAMEGQLTTTVHLVASDEPLAARLVPILERKAGRLIANGWPTGVEVSRAMVHGGPFPATSDGRSTSVGTLSMERFLRPVCYQDFPDALLP